VLNSLSGRLTDGTRTNNGSAGGTFQGTGGVYTAERRLRLLLGLPISDGQILRPVDEPVMARVSFDWMEVLPEALTRRAELRRQKWVVKRRELELIASRKFLQPELDVVARYRWHGFGKDLFQQDSGEKRNLGGFDVPGANNAYDSLTSGDFQEWQLGLEFNMPIGYRRACAAIRQAELRLARSRSILSEQEREISHGLSNAVAEIARAWHVAKTTWNRRRAAARQYEILKDKFEKETLRDLDQLLESQRRLADAGRAWHQATVEYALAIRNLHFEKGSLLDFNQIWVSEGGWSRKAYADARERVRRRRGPFSPKHCHSCPKLVSEGPSPQLVVPSTLSSLSSEIPVPAPAPAVADPPRIKPADGGPELSGFKKAEG